MLAVTDQQAQKLLFVMTQTGGQGGGNGVGWSLQLRPVSTRPTARRALPH